MFGWEEEVNLIIPTILDPYFKMTLLPPEKHAEYKEMLINEIQKECPATIDMECESVSTCNELNMFEEVKDYFAGTSRVDVISPPAIDEKLQTLAVEDYLTRPAETNYSDVASFWRSKLNQAKYPHLTQLYTKFCCAPATSSESERLFSTVNTTLNDMRKSLNGEHLEQLVFNHHNILISGFADI
ncbi:unnamed protein product [Meloidogyne enterolobii]|uniref:Uncharacterized protein n=1 Tax=Meloidogyne enterolobii TaxID=390850 RepID=A0ACB1B3J6_MELEN